VFAGLLAVIIIGLLVENVIFRTVEARTVALYPGPAGATEKPVSAPDCPETAPSSAPPAGAEGPGEGSKPPLSKLKKTRRLFHDGAEGGDSPAHFDVDTMEYRASDANLYDYRAAGPL